MEEKANPHYKLSGENVVLNKMYLVKKRLGKGSYGTVFKAYDKVEKREVALKISRYDDTIETNTELRHLISVKRVPEFVQLINYFEFDVGLRRHKVIVLEKMENDLRTVLEHDSGYVWHEDNVKTILVQVTKALVFLHKENIIHGDLKPENILLAEDPGMPDRDFSEFQRHLVVKVADFGLARKAPASGPIQTRSYRAPEVVRKKKYGTAVDIWSLGVTAYLFAAGASLFRIEKVDDAKVQDREHLNKIAHICGFVYGRKQAEDEGSQNKKIDHTFDKFYYLLSDLDWEQEDVVCFAEWMSMTLQTNPKKRATAEACLNHQFLSMRQRSEDEGNEVERDSDPDEEDTDGDSEEDWEEADSKDENEEEKISIGNRPPDRKPCSEGNKENEPSIEIIYEGKRKPPKKEDKPEIKDEVPGIRNPMGNEKTETKPTEENVCEEPKEEDDDDIDVVSAGNTEDQVDEEQSKEDEDSAGSSSAFKDEKGDEENEEEEEVQVVDVEDEEEDEEEVQVVISPKSPPTDRDDSDEQNQRKRATDGGDGPEQKMRRLEDNNRG